MAARLCSECKTPLVNADGTPKPNGTKTCGAAKCRSRRQRRIAAEKKRVEELRAQGNPLPEGLHELSLVNRQQVQDVGRELVKEELAPIVREQLTNKVLEGIDDLIGMTPRAIQLIQAHMESDDETIAQRAVTLLLKYTLGNPSVAPAPQDEKRGALTIQFNIPRPGDEPEVVVNDEHAEGDPQPQPEAVTDAEEVRECLDCHEWKPVSEFVGSSDKCKVCHTSMQGLLRARFGDAYKG